jgi:hypothetical protein
MTDDPFVAHHSLLFKVAYEMPGSVADAEDVLQEAWRRWGASTPDGAGVVVLRLAGMTSLPSPVALLPGTSTWWVNQSSD